MEIYSWIPEVQKCCKKGTSFQGPGVGSCLIIRNELSIETHVLTKQETLLGRGARVESSRVREPKGTAWPRGSQSRVLCDGIRFRVVFSQSFWVRVLPGGASLVQPRWRPARGIRGGGRTYGVSFRLFLNSSTWWWLICSLFFTRISCPKATHANGY